jgi:two-component system response regulator WspF
MRIAIVNDMPIAVEALRRALALAPQHSVAWIAVDGCEAVEHCRRDRPDMVLMDLLMPKMNGVEATRRIMAETPCPILLVTGSVDGNTSHVFDALGHGALDAIDTPVLGLNAPGDGALPLLRKIAAIEVLIDDHPRESLPTARADLAPGGRPALVAIGSSAGGPAALATVLNGLPANFPAAVVIVQHIDENFASGLASWLQQHSATPVRLAEDGDILAPGIVFLAAPGSHLVLRGQNRLRYSAEPANHPYRPSVDVFFKSIEAHWAGDAIGVLLTGMGRDGAEGLKRLRDHGYHTIAQDRATCAVYGMPAAAAKIDAASDILPLPHIAPRLVATLDAARTRGMSS